jgi:RHS repeat-associated protein
VTLTVDAAGYVTREDLPDGRNRQYQYQSAYHALISMIDERGKQTKFGYDSSGHLVTITNALNQVTTNSYNADGTLKSTTDALNHTYTFGYDTYRRLETVKDPLGNVGTYTYDDHGNMRTYKDPENRVTTYTNDVLGRTLVVLDALNGLWSSVYNGAGLMTESQDALGRKTVPTYDERGLVTKSVSAVGTAQEQSQVYQYDTAGQSTGSRDANAVWNYQSFDSAGRYKTSTDAFGGVRENYYDLAGQLIKTKDELGRVHQNTYNNRGWMTESMNALNQRTTYGYDEAGNRTTTKDALGNTYTSVYDDLGRQTVSITPLGLRATTVFDAAGNVESVKDARGIETRYFYDDLNRRTKTVEAYGTSLARTLTSVYDKVGNLTASINALGHAYTFGYDALNRRVTVKDPLSHVNTSAYNAVGNLISVTDALNKTVTYGYDALDRRISTTDPLNHITTVILDANGRAVGSVDALGQASITGHDVLGRGAFQFDALGGMTRNRYDADGNLISLTDPVGNETTWLHDELGREIRMTDPNGKSGTFAYDAAGRLSSQTDRFGRRKDFTYDTDNRLSNEVWVASGGATTNRVTFTYNENGQILTAKDNAGNITYTYDELGRLSTQNDVWNTTLTFSYDAADRQTKIQDSFAGVLTSVYDNANRLTSRQFGGVGQTPLRLDLEYNLRDEVTTMTRFSDLSGTTIVGTSIYTIDDAHRLTRIDHKNGSGTALASYVYAYDDADRLTQETINGTPRTFSYDRTDQLTNDGGTAYTFDANGNRTMTGYQTIVANRMSNDGTYTYTYDDAGNTIKKSKGASDETWTYNWDHNNRLTVIEKRATDGGTLLLSVTYTYDVFGRRVQQQKWKTGVGTTTERYVYDTDDNVLIDMDGSNALTMRRGFLGQDQAVWRVASNGTASWYGTDHQQNVRLVLNNSGSVIDQIGYSGWGVVISESSPANGDRYAGTGRERDDDTGLRNHRARYYDPVTGRWLSEDPIRFKAGDWHLYRYVHNQPPNRADPSGLQDIKKPDREAVTEVKVANGFRFTPVRMNGLAWRYQEMVQGETFKSSIRTREIPVGQMTDTFGTFVWPVRLELNGKADAGKGGWILQRVKRRIVDLKTNTLVNQYTQDYWEAFRVERGASHPSQSEASKDFIDTFSRFNLDLKGVVANDWFALIGIPGTNGKVEFIGELYYLDGMDESDLPTSWGYLSEAGGLRSTMDHKSAYELVKKYKGIGPFAHEIEISWTGKGAMTIDRTKP